MHNFNRFIRTLSAALVIITLIVTLAPSPAIAKGKVGKRKKPANTTVVTTTDIKLIVPANLETCNPNDSIKTTGVPDDAKVYYVFFIYDAGSLVKIADGWVTGNLNVPFPYPEIRGTMTFSAAIAVFNENTLLFKVQKKWTVTCDEPPPPPDGKKGCTPGYWRQEQHYDSWVGYSPFDDFETVFGVDASFDPHKFLDAVWLGGGGEFALARHAVAALLNSSNQGVGYLYNTTEVIALVQQAYTTGDFEAIKNMFEAQNEMGCPLN
jgi:hypothetical protein